MSKKKKKEKVYSGGRSFEDLSLAAHRAIETRRLRHPEWGMKKDQAEIKRNIKKEKKEKNEIKV